MKSFLKLQLLLLIAGIVTASAQAYLDTVVFGNTASEASHSFVGPVTFVITNNAVFPGQTARRGSTNNPATVNGGSLTFTMAVDPVWRNYFTVKFWGSDDVSPTSGQDNDMGRLHLYVPASNFVAGLNTNYQVGYRHEGDYISLNASTYKPPLPGRFFYSTTILPLWMTQGRTNLTLTIQPAGRIYALGSGGPPSGNYQFNMFTNSRGIYQAYTHTEPVLNPVGEAQGSAPVATVRPATGSSSVSTLSPGGSYYNGCSNYLSGRMSANVSTFTVNDFLQLGKAYSISNFPVTYTNPALVTKIIAAADYYASNYYANPSVVNGWGGNYGPIGWGIHLLSPQLQASLDVTNGFGVGGNVSRRKAWGDMLLASREHGRFNRNNLSNQGLISGSYIYMANRALLDLGNASAFAEEDAQRYLKEAIGLAPWLGSDLPGGGSSLAFGTNYLQVTPKGQTREWGYVGVSYGELQFYAADFYAWTTNPVFLAQAVKMTQARAPFRRPAILVTGGSNYRCMEGIGLLAWRSAVESDAEFANEIAYGDRTGGMLGLRCAAVTGDTNLIGYAKQMFADNQYFNTLSANSLGSSGDARDGLEVFRDYNIVAAAPDSGVRLPMTDGQPDFAWADEENGIVAVKRGNERLWLATYWQAKDGTGVNGIGRFHYSTNNFDRYGMLEVTPQIAFSGSFFVRPNLMDKPEANLYTPPDNPLQAYLGERLPIAANDPLATDDGPFRGKALFWTTRYGNFLIGINRSQNQTYQLRTPAEFVSATNLITGQNLSGPISVAPQSTVILYLASATDPCQPPQAPLSLNAAGDATPKVVLDWSAAAGATGYQVKRATSSGGLYATIASVATTNYTDPSVTRGVSYYYVVSATNACGESYYHSMEDIASGGLPSPWTDADVGSVGVAGSGNYNNGTFTISGEGFDIGSASDTFNYAYLTMTNSGTFVARLVAQQGNGKIGLMLRESTNANSKMVAVLLDTAQGRARQPSRSSTGGNMSWIDGPTLSAPKWFRMQRSGNTFTSSVSDDGVSWTSVGTNTISMNSIMLAGFAVCSRSSGNLTVATFDNVTLPTWTPPPNAPLNVIATASNAAVALNWNAATNATGYHVKRTLVSGGGYTTIGSLAGTNYTDSGLSNGTRFYYIVTATNLAGESGSSLEVSAQPVSLTPIAFATGLNGNQLELTWPATHTGWRLEAQTNALATGLGTNWFTVSGSAATNQMFLPVAPATGSVFFRLTYP